MKKKYTKYEKQLVIQSHFNDSAIMYSKRNMSTFECAQLNSEVLIV